jgi:hypothetical protein
VLVVWQYSPVENELYPAGQTGETSFTQGLVSLVEYPPVGQFKAPANDDIGSLVLLFTDSKILENNPVMIARPNTIARLNFTSLLLKALFIKAR